MKAADYLEVLELARWAPSSHNTQPWLVNVEGGGLIVNYDPSRHLKVGDPEMRELYMSLGCFIETFILAAEAVGRKAEYKFLGSAARVAELRLAGQIKQVPEFAGLIRSRRSDRGKFEPHKPSEAIVNKLGSLKQGKANVFMTISTDEVNFLGDMTFEATLELMSPPAFREELAGWIRHNWTRRPDGMPGYTQGIPGPISLIGPKLIKRVSKTAQDQAKKDGGRVRQAVGVALICTTGKTKADWVDAGRLFQRFWLELERAGLRASAISPATISVDTSRQISDRLDLTGCPVGLLRFGYSGRKPPKASPRLTPAQFANI